jgi:Uma2 family endonuclease
MATQSAPLTLEEFHRLYDGRKPAYEYWFGRAIQKPMPTLLHSLMQAALILLLEKAGWISGPEVRLKASKEAEPVPDLIASRNKFKGRYPIRAPELCIEILSPDQRLKRMIEKAKHYIAWGASDVWIVDPEKRTAWQMRNDETLTWVSPDGSLTAGETEISLTDLFQEIDRKLETEE